MKSLLSVLIALVVWPTFAQQKHTVKLSIDPSDPKTYWFKIDSVIDNRFVRDNIGMAQVGLGNRQVEAVMENTLEASLKQFFEQACLKQNGQKSLIAIIDELNVTEKTYQLKERGIAEAQITFLSQGENSLLKQGTFQFREETGGMDVTQAHGKRLKTVLLNCLEQLQNQGYVQNAAPFTIGGKWTPADAEHNILTCKTKQRGIYATFQEMRSNSPSISDTFSISSVKDLYILRLSNGKKAKEPYGFCDGKSIYINTFFYNQTNGEGVYAKVQEEGRYLLWVDHYVSAGEGAAMGAAFGMIGYAIAKNGSDCIILDTESGVIIPLTDRNVKRLLKQYPDLQSRYGNAFTIKSHIAMIKDLNARAMK